ncbi:MAG TPA: hypothetical protein VIP98_13650 [Microlunatus sp.]
MIMNDAIMNDRADHRSAASSGWIRNALWVLLGVVSGAGIVFGLGAMHGPPLSSTTAMTPATAVGVAALCYLTAAVTGLRWMSWVAVPLASVLPFVGLVGPVPWWLIVALVGLVLAVVGVIRSPTRSLPQTVAMVAYFGLAVLALALAPRAGLVLAGVVLAAHAGWDLIHYRRNRVVVRSFAVWCIGLDLTVGAICVALAITG